MVNIPINKEEIIEAEGWSAEKINWDKTSPQLVNLLLQTDGLSQDTISEYTGMADFQRVKLPKAPDNLNIFEAADRYCKHYPDYWVFEKLNTNITPDEYMAFIHQKGYTKAYFVEFLKIIEQYCEANNKKVLLTNIRWNLQDETGIRYPDVPSPEFQNIPWGEKIADHLPNTDESYRLMAHSQWRVDMKNGYEREYQNYVKDNHQKPYDYKNPYSEWEVRNDWTLIFNMLTEEMLAKRDPLEILWAMMFLEPSIPVELQNMVIARDKLFPNMDWKEKVYEDDHIFHDIEHHTEWLIEGINDAHFTPEEEQRIKDGMYKMFVTRGIFYKWFVDQLESMKNGVKPNDKKTRIIEMYNSNLRPWLIKTWVAASLVLAVMYWAKEKENHQQLKAEIESPLAYSHLWDGIKITPALEKEVCEKNGISYSEYKNSDNFWMVDFIGWEINRAAILKQKGIDIWAYAW